MQTPERIFALMAGDFACARCGFMWRDRQGRGKGVPPRANGGYIARILDRKTGEVVDCQQDLDWHEGSAFWWSEGNFGCDCNRFLEFERGKGRNPHPNDATCRQEGFPNGRYVVLAITLPNGAVVYWEDPKEKVR